jgi:hypothetical protein
MPKSPERQHSRIRHGRNGAEQNPLLDDKIRNGTPHSLEKR